MALVTVDLDLPDGVEFKSYERCGEGHGLQVSWAMPERCTCQRCGREDAAHIEYKPKVQVIRDLPLWEQPSFLVYQSPFHRCRYCNCRQDIIPPFKRKDTKYTLRFEEYVLRMLIGSNEEEVAGRLSISAETVIRIVQNQLKDVKPIDPKRVITDIGMDELSLKKRHKLYATLMIDLSNPEQPRILAVAQGKDQKAGEQCLERLSPEQRAAIQTHRVDMGAAYPAACGKLLAKSRCVTDRFHVAKKFNDEIDGQRKKNHPCLQGETEQGGAEEVSFADVGLPPRSGDADDSLPAWAGTAVSEDTRAAAAASLPCAFQGDL